MSRSPHVHAVRLDPESDLGKSLDELFGIKRAEDGSVKEAGLSGVGKSLHDTLTEAAGRAAEHIKAEMRKRAQPGISPEKQLTLLRTFVSHRSHVGRGDRIVLNSYGEDHYTMPVEGQIAIVTDKFDNPFMNDDGNIVNGEIATVVNGKIQTYLVDLRGYRKHAEDEMKD